MCKCLSVRAVTLYMAAVCLLSGCGTRQTEGPSGETRAEDAVQTETVVQEDITEEMSLHREEADRSGEAEREAVGQPPALVDVTWESSGLNIGGCILYFTFTDGTVITEYVELASSVENITYQDITGDGIDEVMVSSLFWNNTMTDYPIFYFYEVKDGITNDISPLSHTQRIKRNLGDKAWYMTLLQEQEEDYALILELESFEKISGFGYTDCIMIIGFDGTEWQIIQQQTVPEWKEAYVQYLCRNLEGNMFDTARFVLDNVDGDEIPELFYYADSAQANASVITYESGKVKEVAVESVQEAVRGIAYENGMTFSELRESLLWELRF